MTHLEIDKELYNKVNEITKTNYNPIFLGDMVLLKCEEINYIIEDLIAEYEQKNMELQELERDVKDNYKPIPVSEQYDVSDGDFIWRRKELKLKSQIL